MKINFISCIFSFFLTASVAFCSVDFDITDIVNDNQHILNDVEMMQIRGKGGPQPGRRVTPMQVDMGDGNIIYGDVIDTNNIYQNTYNIYIVSTGGGDAVLSSLK